MMILYQNLFNKAPWWKKKKLESYNCPLYKEPDKTYFTSDITMCHIVRKICKLVFSIVDPQRRYPAAHSVNKSRIPSFPKNNPYLMHMDHFI